MKPTNALLYVVLTSLAMSALSAFLLFNFIPAGRTMFSDKKWVLSKTESMSDVSELKNFTTRMADSIEHIQNSAELCLKWIFCLNAITAGLLVWSVNIIRSRAKTSKDQD